MRRAWLSQEGECAPSSERMTVNGAPMLGKKTLTNLCAFVGDFLYLNTPSARKEAT